MFDQSRIVRTGAIIGGRQFCGAGRVALKQLAVMALNDVEMTQQIPGECGAVLIAEKAGEALHRLDIVGQRVGLLVGHHLQPVLDPPQKFIGRRHLVTRLEGDPVARRQHLQRFQRRPYPQFEMPAAGDQLLGLREKLDFEILGAIR